MIAGYCLALYITAASHPAESQRASTQAVAHPVHAATQPRPKRPAFGQEGIVTIGGTTTFQLQQSWSTPNQLMFSINPEVGYFLVPHVLLGGAMQLRYVHALKTGQATFALGPFGAYHVHIANAWDFLPTVGLLFGFQSVDSEMGEAVPVYSGVISLMTKFLYTMAEPLQISISPYFTYTLYDHSGRVGTYGIALGLQGWL